jgi:hypothetical protein
MRVTGVRARRGIGLALALSACSQVPHGTTDVEGEVPGKTQTAELSVADSAPDAGPAPRRAPHPLAGVTSIILADILSVTTVSTVA